MMAVNRQVSDHFIGSPNKGWDLALPCCLSDVELEVHFILGSIFFRFLNKKTEFLTCIIMSV